MHLRRATLHDLPAIERVMRGSLETLGRTAYDDAQIASSLRYVARPDRQIVEDGTYFVVVDDAGEVVACGGWSRRGKLYAGSAAAGGEERMLEPATEPARVRAMFTLPTHARRGLGRMILERCESEARAHGFARVELMAMASGRAMYDACGYRVIRETKIVLEDGVSMDGALMEKEL